MTADRYAVIGNPIAHSQSPRIHSLFAGATGEAVEYGRIEAPVGGFEASAEEFFAAGGRGLNVTVPFKRDAFRWVAAHDEAAAVSGAVNTIVPQGHDLRGCNTDGAGLVADLAGNLGWDLAGARVLLLGAGGAARGVVPALAAAAPETLAIANRTVARGREVAALFEGVEAMGLADVGAGWDLVINATSASMAGEPVAIDSSGVGGARCYDMFYRVDGATAFCAWAQENGAAATADGLGMLVEQAAEAFRLWRGVRPATAPVLRALRDVAR